MQNPSQGLQAPLQNHVHLISGHRFPVIASLDLNQALTYLLDAPTIVKTVAPMSWTYVQAPSDGTIWLEWLPPDKADGRFPSDGYVWADTESTYRHDFRGYTIEMMKHTIGYRMNHDQMASHARTRFHIVAKNPSVNAAPPDPALWIVHYHQGDRPLPSSQVPFPPQMQQIMQERKWLENQGKLERRDFMLHDRQSWPQITVPTGNRGQGMQQQGMYGHPASQASRFPQYYPQQAGQQPPAKRQRPNPPVAGASSDGIHDMSIEEEENTTQGDFFDHLTPRDISMARYMQHHRWMEEVFSSPYASNQLVPTDLGLGLMGELKGLTDGLLDPPALETANRPTKPNDAQPFTNLSKDQLEEFNTRVAKHLEEGRAEIERMKANHAKKMQEWKKTKLLMHAEKRLRQATWEGHESAVPVFRFEGTGADAYVEDGARKETVQDIVKEVEKLLGVKINGRKEAELVEKGGLEKEEELPREQTTQDPLPEQSTGFMSQQEPISGAPAQPSMYHQDAASTSMQAPQQDQKAQQQMHVQPMAPPPQPATSSSMTTDMHDTDVNDTSMMDNVDVGDTTVDFGESQLDVGEAKHAPATTLQARELNPPAPIEMPLKQPPTTEKQQQQSAQQPTTSDPPNDVSLVGADNGLAENTTGVGDDSMFNEDMFGDLTNSGEGEAEDEEFDFAATAAGMDDSAFGDATYAMGNEAQQGGQ
ncbi:hypothetical protein LTR59_008678 [Friedmanniomyces endolithicus]|nr:hypothetical protein LTR94_008726 [Friedmanniomyces endolithicus]KAK0775101.1 hypothetical protein LTR75_016680 [Friedmanniomyces endolithicus]KAK0781759.1 hypothetical protein LTR38_013616 [Friedmanniomyces endolithicus]KAK0791978.1 hypothetical protein LTR59_008678 [Friedmanniomyces endolithicus]KAK0862256.1 hypothetical protein LTR87_016652 [Friedmanniomyces endolithicus]